MPAQAGCSVFPVCARRVCRQCRQNLSLVLLSSLSAVMISSVSNAWHLLSGCGAILVGASADTGEVRTRIQEKEGEPS